MRTIQDCSDPNLVRALETNWCNVIAQWGQSPRAHVKKSSDQVTVVSSVPFGSLNSVCLAQLTSENVDEKITEITGYYKSHGVPFRWFVGPSTKPHDITEHLEQHGFEHSWTRPCMAIDLNQLEEGLTKPDNFTVEPVKDVEALSEWAHVLRLADEGTASSERNWFTFEADLGFSETLGRYRYLGYLNGEPVATSLMYTDSGVAGIYAVSTIPKVRRRGIGTAITLEPLKMAREKGYKVGVLGSTKMAFGVYSRMGFREFAKMTVYSYSEEKQ